VMARVMRIAMMVVRGATVVRPSGTRSQGLRATVARPSGFVRPNFGVAISGVSNLGC